MMKTTWWKTFLTIRETLREHAESTDGKSTPHSMSKHCNKTTAYKVN